MAAIPPGDEHDPDDSAAVPLSAAISAIVRGEPTSLDTCLSTDVSVGQVDGTATISRVHLLKKDGNGRVMMPALADTLACRIVEFCIPRTRIDQAYGYWMEWNDGRRVARLHREAADLFTKLAKSGEGGELLLYTLLETFLGIPQVLCKMSLKTAENMHIHGADGVHAKGLDDGRLAVYWGESKLYGSVSKAIAACMSSLEEILTDVGRHRDVLLVRDNLHAGDLELTARLIEFFDPESARSTELVVRGACLIGFSTGDDDYPDCADHITGEVDEALTKAVDGWKRMLKKQVLDRKLARFEIEVFLLPFPSVEDFRAQMLKELGIR